MIQSAPNNYKSRGFTLIELMVVIAIIAILATVGIIVYGNTQKAARISKRIQDLNSIETALQVYYTANQSYPTTSGAWRSQCSAWGSYPADQVIPGFTPTYMKALPADPSMNTAANTSCYLYQSNGTDYKAMDYNIIQSSGGEMTQADINAQPNLMDPTYSTTIWAIWSSPTSQNW